MTKVTDILDYDKLLTHVIEKEVSQRFHPEFPELSIFNYTEITAFNNIWSHETKTARGLIVNTDTMEVLARPFAKFFNYGQEAGDGGDHSLDLDARVYWVGDKADGSLGIPYLRPDHEWAIATRGSFESEQAIHATKNLTTKDKAKIIAHYKQGLTPLFEIIYPENRIVLNYGDRDELIYLGAVDIDSGKYVTPHDIDSQTFWNLRSVLEAPPRPNAEGFVVWLDPYKAVKIKQEDYVALHRIVTGLNRKSIWRAMKDGTFQDLVVQLPDELFKWAEDVYDELAAEYLRIYDAVEYVYQDIISELNADGPGWGQKDFALKVQEEEADRPFWGLLFAWHAAKPVRESIFKMIEPMGGDK